MYILIKFNEVGKNCNGKVNWPYIKILSNIWSKGHTHTITTLWLVRMSVFLQRVLYFLNWMLLVFMRLFCFCSDFFLCVFILYMYILVVDGCLDVSCHQLNHERIVLWYNFYRVDFSPSFISVNTTLKWN